MAIIRRPTSRGTSTADAVVVRSPIGREPRCTPPEPAAWTIWPRPQRRPRRRSWSCSPASPSCAWLKWMRTSRKVVAPHPARYVNIMKPAARRCRIRSRGAVVRRRGLRLHRRVLHAHRLGGCSPAQSGGVVFSTREDSRRSTAGARPRPSSLARDMARVRHPPLPASPWAQLARAVSLCAAVARIS